MASPMEHPWSEPEKVILLTEILRAAHVPSDLLVRIIAEHQIGPQWHDTPLPAGRSLRSCQIMYSSLFNQQPMLSPAQPQGIMQQPLQMPYPPGLMDPDQARKKRPRPSNDPPTPGTRILQPRPPTTFHSINGSPYMSSTGDEPTILIPKKKRGRPSKAEIERRTAEAAARGDVYPPPRKPKGTPGPKKAESTATGGQIEAAEGAEGAEGTDASPTATMAPAAAGSSNPTSPTGSFDSSKRRGRPTKLEAQTKRMLEIAAAATSDEAAGAAAPATAPATAPAPGPSHETTTEPENTAQEAPADVEMELHAEADEADEGNESAQADQSETL